MERPKKLEPEAVTRWLSEHAGWALGDGQLRKEFRFPDYPATLAYVVRLGFAAEKRDHHPDLLVGWGRVQVSWTTHDAGGITALDLALAERADELAHA